MKNHNHKILLGFSKSLTYNLFLKNIAESLNQLYDLTLITSDKKKLENKNIKALDIDLPKNFFSYINIFSLIKKIFLINLKLYQFKNHYILINTPNLSFFLRIFVLLKFKKIIYFVHGFRFHSKGNFFTNKIYFFIEKILSYRTDYYIVINNEDYNVVKNNFNKPCLKISGVGINQFDIINNKKLKKNDLFRIGVLGAYRNNKGYLKLIKLAKNLNNEIIINCYGYDDKNIYLKKIKKLKLKNIILNDFTNDIYSKIDNFDILLHLSNREGLCFSIIQCLSRGVPVLGYNIRGVNDLIINSFNGYLFEFDDNKKIVETIYKLKNDQKLLQELSNNAIKSIDENYTSKYINSKIIKFFRNIIK